MKKIVLSLCLIAIACSSYGQKIYFRAGGGYGIPVAKQTIGQTYFRSYDPQTQEQTYTVEDVSASFGSGVNFNVGAGYMFSKYLGVDLNIQYLKSKKYEISDRETNVGQGVDNETQTINANAIFINPALIITPGTGSKVPYGRFGVIIGAPKIKGKESYYYDQDGIDEEEREWEMKKGTAFGFQGAVGLNWAIANALDIYAEVNFISMTYYPGEMELTKDISNGDDILDDLDVREKKTIFKKKIELTEGSDPDEPSQSLRQSLPFSSVSLQIGVKFTLGGRSTD